MKESQELALSRWLHRHHQVITTNQASRLGISSATMQRLVASGRFSRPYPGVFIHTASRASASAAWWADAAAALGAAGRDAALSHRSAAWSWDLIHPAPRPIDVLLPMADPRSRLGAARLHHTSIFFPPRSQQGLRVTDPVRTIVDLAATFPNLVDGAMDRAVNRRILRAQDLEAAADEVQLGRYQGRVDRRRRGAATLRVHLDRLGYLRPPAPSVLESLMARVFVRYDLPPPRTEYTAGPMGEYRLDFAYPRLKLAIEVDGYRWHSDPARMDADYRRRRRLEMEGWIVLTFTWRQVTGDPEGVAAEIAECYRRLTSRA